MVHIVTCEFVKIFCILKIMMCRDPLLIILKWPLIYCMDYREHTCCLFRANLFQFYYWETFIYFTKLKVFVHAKFVVFFCVF